jgi:hypothetical protein
MKCLPIFSLLLLTSASAQGPVQISGVYPALASFNNVGECGTGAVVPWADRLWVITYGPHLPFGSCDKLYEITPDLRQIVRPESVGGTPANRMVHRESGQLFIGPYVIDSRGGVRVIPPSMMPGRLTGNARHLEDPAGRIYFATMEQGLYEVDVNTLEVTGLIRDGNRPKPGFSRETRPAAVDGKLPGYHGKGLYSSQGRVVYAQNGDRDRRAVKDPTIPSGALGEWRKAGEDWQLVRRNQFTEVTGPGGITGADHPESDPVWSIGWDQKSLILMLLDGGVWHSFRLPKVSHAYDGAHGWNTEWPRIREIGETDLLMTMHGAFWRFPRTFSAANTGGIRVRSAYLKVIGDFCRWQDRLVFGCDDTAKSEFLNKRKVKGGIAGPGQSQSNLWFTDTSTPDKLGPAHASGALWLREPVRAGESSEPFLVAGWSLGSVWLINHGKTEANFESPLGTVAVAPGASRRLELKGGQEWIQFKALSDAEEVSVVFTLSNADLRVSEPDAAFGALVPVESPARHSGGLLWVRGEDRRSLAFRAQQLQGEEANDSGLYELDEHLSLKAIEDPVLEDAMKSDVAIPENVISADASSVLVVDDRGRRWRLPKHTDAYDAPTEAGLLRICREVSTERDVFSAYGTFYELPAENADGFAKIRPVATHGYRVMDYASYRGMLVMSGVRADASGEHVIRSEDGKVALWAGAIDDLWRLGKPRGQGGPWLRTAVAAAMPSDPYLIWGYDRRELSLSHDQTASVEIDVELDLTGTEVWVKLQTVAVPAGETLRVKIDRSIQARWLRTTARASCTATAQLRYD